MEQQTAITQKIEEAVAIIKRLQQEKDEAIAQSQMLKQENDQMKTFLARTESQLDEILLTGSANANQQPKEKVAAVNPN